MAVLTVDVYSGRPNATVEVGADVEGLILESFKTTPEEFVAVEQPNILGFRRFILEPNEKANVRIAAATNLDNSRNVITDPRVADRGPYTAFCGFYRVGPGPIRIA